VTPWSTELKVGSFVLISSLVIGYMFFMLSPDIFQGKNKKQYYTIFENAGGIVTKTSVKANGVTIGKVSVIKLLDHETRIEIEIDGQIKIPVGSEMVIKEKGLLGDVFLEILRGKDNGAYLEEGALIPASLTHMSMSALIANAGEVAQDLKKISRSFADVLGGKEGADRVHDIIFDLHDLIKGLKNVVEENRANLKQTVDDFTATSHALRKVVGGNQVALQEIVHNVKELTEGMKDIIVGDNKGKLQHIVASMETTMKNVEVVSKELHSITSKVDKGQGTLGRLVNDDVALTKMEDTLTDLRKLLAPAARLQVEVAYRGEARRDKSQQNYFDLVLRTRPDKFYLLGFVDGHNATRDTTYETLTPTKDTSPDIEGKPSRVLRIDKQESAIRFNLQFGKRWNDVQLRFGLFETTGGFAGDFFFWKDRLKLSVEAFDWGGTNERRKVAHIKTYLGMVFFSHLYGYVGVDDWTRIDGNTGHVQKTPNYFLGAGLDFTDDDLTALLGAASLATVK